jgi:hypothetical protein
VLVKVIFGLGTFATLIAIFLRYKKDRDRRLLVLGGIGIVASVACFAITSIDLAKFKAPREISPEQQKRITEKMKEFTRQEYTGWVTPGVVDAWMLWKEIGSSLDMVGWKFWCFISRPIDKLYGHEASIWQAPFRGVMIFWPIINPNEIGLPQEELQAKAGKADAMRPPAQALAEALTAEGLPAVGGPIAEVPNHPVVVVAIGPKRRNEPATALPMKPYRGPPMTLGVAAAAGVRLIGWCKACQQQVEPDPTEMARQYGSETSVHDWRERLVCTRCGSRQVEMVVTGTARR